MRVIRKRWYMTAPKYGCRWCGYPDKPGFHNDAQCPKRKFAPPTRAQMVARETAWKKAHP